MSEETLRELLARHKRVGQLIAAKKAKLVKMKWGGDRERAARFIGCLGFTLLQIESEIRERENDKRNSA